MYSVIVHATACLAGNEYLAMLTAVVPYILRVDMTDWAGNTAYAEYSSFVVRGAATNYTLSSVGNYSGTADTSKHCGWCYSWRCGCRCGFSLWLALWLFAVAGAVAGSVTGAVSGAVAGAVAGTVTAAGEGA